VYIIFCLYREKVFAILDFDFLLDTSAHLLIPLHDDHLRQSKQQRHITMAKSLRASSKVKARNARRYNDNTDYAVAQAARLNALSQRLKERTRGPTVTEQSNRKDREGSDLEDVQEEAEVDGSKG
jgi:hypothetical protein